jgi:hypothetical protein
MLSQKNQAADTWTLLQIPQVRPTLKIGGIPKIKMGPICMIPIRYPNFAHFSDMSMGHKISSHGRISDLFQI